MDQNLRAGTKPPRSAVVSKARISFFAIFEKFEQFYKDAIFDFPMEPALETPFKNYEN